MLDLDHALDQLAPEVDAEASRALFDRHRAIGADRSPTGGIRRAVLVAIAAVVVLVLGIGTVVARTTDDAVIDTAGSDGAAPPAEAAPTTERLAEPAATDDITPAPDPAPPAGDLRGAVPLPPVGGRLSAVLDDGLPVWVVHHPDGTVSVLPALVPDYSEPSEVTMSDGSTFVAPQMTGMLVFVLAGDGGFAAVERWDLHGRARGDRSRDLVGLRGEIQGQQVVVTSSSEPIPGDPEVEPPIVDMVGQFPRLPDPVPSLDGLTPGWHQLVAMTVIGVGGEMRLCPAPLDAYPSTDDVCDGPIVSAVAAPEGRLAELGGSPLLVEVDASGTITRVANGGGWSVY